MRREVLVVCMAVLLGAWVCAAHADPGQLKWKHTFVAAGGSWIPSVAYGQQR